MGFVPQLMAGVPCGGKHVFLLHDGLRVHSLDPDLPFDREQGVPTAVVGDFVYGGTGARLGIGECSALFSVNDYDPSTQRSVLSAVQIATTSDQFRRYPMGRGVEEDAQAYACSRTTAGSTT